MPGTATLARQQATDQAWQLGLPTGFVLHGQQQAGGVGIAVVHQPPPGLIVFRTKAKLGAAVVQTALQQLQHLLLALLALG